MNNREAALARIFTKVAYCHPSSSHGLAEQVLRDPELVTAIDNAFVVDRIANEIKTAEVEKKRANEMHRRAQYAEGQLARAPRLLRTIERLVSERDQALNEAVALRSVVLDLRDKASSAMAKAELRDLAVEVIRKVFGIKPQRGWFVMGGGR